MQLNDFIQKCKDHDWDYHKTDDSQIYYLGKKRERELFIAIKQHPEWYEIYKAFERGEFARNKRLVL